MAFEGISRFTLVSSILTGLSLLFHLIGFGAPYWHKTKYDVGIVYYSNMGLWKKCSTTPIFGEICTTFTANTDWLRAVQAFETLGLLGLIGVLVVILMKSFVLKNNKILSLVTILLQAGAGGLILLGIIIFGAEVKADFGYAFVMCIIGALFSLAAGVLTFVDYRVDGAPN